MDDIVREAKTKKTMHHKLLGMGEDVNATRTEEERKKTQ
jgi:hypothetical protein